MLRQNFAGIVLKYLRGSQMEKISFEIELVTPMFMGGADPQNQPELRAASLRGLLRFWFRAIYPNEVEAEQEVFGAMGKRSPLKLTVEPVHLRPGRARSPNLRDYNYLGYGLIGHDRQSRQFLTVRPYLEPGSTFRVTFTFSPLVKDEDKEEVIRSFWALAMLGGLGARSRRGFGAFYVTSVTPSLKLAFTMADEKEYEKKLQSFIQNISKVSGLPEYSCFSDKSQVICGPALKDGGTVLAGFNEVLQGFRSYYEKFPSTPKTSGIPKQDHDLMYKFLKNSRFTPSQAPARAIFGLPHNYYFRTTRQKGFVDLMEGTLKGRRASPLFIHIQRLTNGKACGVVTFLPARFLPPGRKITLSDERGRSIEVNPPGDQAIIEFINDMLKKGAIKVL
jgi:CRISPR-associated protein Cmr1